MIAYVKDKKSSAEYESVSGQAEIDRKTATVELSTDVVIVGAGPAGLAAATSAATAGASVLVLERAEYVGGVLPQCVHDGFGLHVHGVSMTGPEYAREWERRAHKAGADIVLDSDVLRIKRDGINARESKRSHLSQGGFLVEVVSTQLGGHVNVRAGSVVVATGCRERTRGQLGIPGTRPAGVMTAGSAQYMMNVCNMLPGDKAVILGSGDIGLIMARRLTLEGAEVRLVLGQEATGLLRNHIRCIQDFSIPIRYGWGVSSIHGIGRLKGVSVAPLLPDGTFNLERREYIRCNLLLIACGLIPEREVLGDLTVCGESDSASDGLYVCGNAGVPHDLVDQVTQEGLRVGLDAARFALAHGGERITASEMPSDLLEVLSMNIAEPKGRMFDVDVSGATESVRCVPCTVCPNSCIMQVFASGKIQGNDCARGIDFAKSELERPTRMFTGTVKVKAAPSGDMPLLPVRTSGEVPRSFLIPIAKATRHIVAAPPIKCGQVVCRDVASSGADLISCADVGI